MASSYRWTSAAVSPRGSSFLKQRCLKAERKYYVSDAAYMGYTITHQDPIPSAHHVGSSLLQIESPFGENNRPPSVEYAINSPGFGRAMDKVLLVPGTSSHLETAEPVDASNCFIALSDMTKRWLLDQRRLVLNSGVTFTKLLGCA